jgi:hypothetical protein
MGVQSIRLDRGRDITELKGAFREGTKGTSKEGPYVIGGL